MSNMGCKEREREREGISEGGREGGREGEGGREREREMQLSRFAVGKKPRLGVLTFEMLE